MKNEKDHTLPEEAKQNMIDKIIKNIKGDVSPPLRDSLECFIRSYYANVPVEDLEEISLSSLTSSVLSMWDFCLNRKPGQPKIRIGTEKRTIEGHPAVQTIVEIANEDMPFLVDSVTGAINSLGFATYLVIHPVMPIERDKHHNLTAVLAHTADEHNGHYESIMHIEILGLLPPEKVAALKAEISLALQDTRAAVEDWSKMQHQLKIAIEELRLEELKIEEITKHSPAVSTEILSQTVAFLEWLGDNHFTFLGFCEYTFVSEKTTVKRTIRPEKGLGILRNPERQEITHIFEGAELSPVNRRYVIEPDPLLLTKTSEVARVHRRSNMDSITIKRLDNHGNVIGLYQFVGLFTSVAYNISVWEIPLIKQKIANILKRSGFSPQWHDGKALIHILETFPRDEIFQSSEDWLFNTCRGILQLQNRQRLTLFIREDRFERFCSCLIFVPRERYDSALRQKLSDILEHDLKGKVTEWQTQFGELAFARVYLTVRLDKGVPAYDLKTIEDEMIAASLTWRDHLLQALLDKYGEGKGAQLFEKYGKGFSRGYQERFTATDAIADINEIEKTLAQSHLRVALRYTKETEKEHIGLKIYTAESPISLFHILPILENLNFKVLNEVPFVITLASGQKVWLHDFEMKIQEGKHVDLEHFRDNFMDAFGPIWYEKIENDGFNRLIVRANFTWQECQLIRAYAKYLRQLQITFSQAYMEQALANYPHICYLMIQLFACKFDPNTKENRESAQEEIINKIKALLEDVAALDEDRILSKFVNAITSTLRTNYYQLKDGKHKPYVSFKIDCDAIEEMPLPRPKYEIFVHSPHVEAIHLRGGKVARGGIRWSDRKEDFRTEVLGLMKAQHVKNAVIIPVGSKGGFIVKRPPAQDDPKTSLMDEVHLCYATMMEGLLDLTDNIQDDDVITPVDVVRWDDNDPYLVVAADKGTSTFSDFANSIARDYNYWLDDAFASGGSTGYDHKKMAITSRGAWESVKRHFHEMDINADQAELVTVGIGDMAGDVFGNGMLLSKHLKLIGAFNHLHIFIDPTPDPATSYKERKRLFDLPRSSWSDYNPSLISKGGGVFDRKVKSIPITPEMRVAFGISEAALTPAELIQYILKAEVDLIWFGGIGTFVKASTESDNDVGDRVNDSLRIDGIDVRAKVIAEGANLGLTQRGRIEYAKNGGRLNTDAIDNSAGVECSDHEVNLKILLGLVIKEKKLTFNERNQLLKDMTNEVAQLVLRDNFWQNQVISLMQCQGSALLAEQARLIRDLEQEGFLNRALEFLPDEKEIARRMVDKQGLTRPELGVLLAYSKISLKNHLLQSEVPDLSLLDTRLQSYFPMNLREIYKDEILKHPLRREITATLFTNSIINRMGVSFFHEMKRQLGVKGAEVAKAYFVVRELLNLISLWQDLETTQHLLATFQSELMLNIYENVKQMTNWFVRYHEGNRNMEEVMDFFRPDFIVLHKNLSSCFTLAQQETYRKKQVDYVANGIPKDLAERLLNLAPLVSAPDMVLLSKELTIDIQAVAKVYFAVGQKFKFDWLREVAQNLSAETAWQQEASHVLVDDLYKNQIAITKKVLMSHKPLEVYLTEQGNLAEDVLPSKEVDALLSDLATTSVVDFAMMTVMNRRLYMLAES